MKRFLKLSLITVLVSIAAEALCQVYPTHLDGTVLPFGCLSCHAGGHGAKGTALLKGNASELCLRCHDFSSKDKNINIRPESDIRAAMNKGSHHPTEQVMGVSKKGENFPERNPGAKRHVACEDCHDVHWLTKGKPLDRVDGLNSFGVRVIQAKSEYEICYKCHADSANLPKDATNKRLEFNGNNPSFHPVESRGRSNHVPSLIRPMSEQSIITCSDCHGNDDPLGPKGPHGSIYSPILVANYEIKDGLQENSFLFALCYKCHDRNSLLRNESFPFHNLHIIKVNASCFTCHTSHGSQLNTHLIHFNPEIVGPPSPDQQKSLTSAAQQPRATLRFSAMPLIGQTPFSKGSFELGRYVDLGNGHGQCFLTCHGKSHNPLSY